MSSSAVISLISGLMWAGLLYWAVRYRDRWSLLTVGLAWIVNVFLAFELIVPAGVVRIINSGIVVLLLVDRLTNEPEHVRRVAAVQVTDARRKMHEAVNDRAAWEARAVAYRRMLEDHGIHS